GRPTSVLATLARPLGASDPPLVRARMLVTALANMPRLYGTAVAHCEVGQLLADRLDLGPNVHSALFEVFERWDGRGIPRKLKGEAVAFPARVVPLATDALVYFRLGGVDAARTIVRQRSGGAYDPRLVERFVAEADRLFLDVGTTSAWDLALDAEPGRQPRLSPRQLEAALRAMADFVDLKSTSTLGHSTG